MRCHWHIVACALVALSCGDDPNELTGTRTLRRSSSSASGDEAALVGTGSTESEVCWSTINAYRKTRGLPAYQRWTDAEACSTSAAKSDAETNRAHGAFTRCGEFAQNECPGIPGPVEEAIPACLAAMWREGKGGGHYENMASTKFTKAGCGIFVTARGAVWAVQNFR